MATFMNLLHQGKVTSADIDTYIDQWHGNSTESLYEFLGMSLTQYKAWVEDPSLLPLRFPENLDYLRNEAI